MLECIVMFGKGFESVGTVGECWENVLKCLVV